MIRRYLLDTGIAQDLQYDRNGVRKRFDDTQKLGHRIGICNPVLGELWAGIEGSLKRNEAVTHLRVMLAKLIIWPHSIEAAEEYGRVFMELRTSGRMMQQVDVQIGAIARTFKNCIVVSSDSDISAIPGIVVENWSK